MKRIAILGATGSIGVQSLDVIEQFPEDFSAHGLTAHTSISPFHAQIERFGPVAAAISDKDSAARIPAVSSRTRILTGPEGLLEIVTHPEVDLVISALPGSAGFLPTLRALEAGKTVALANKEILVMAGELVMKTAARAGAKILPLDSEHSAVHQCLAGQDMDQVERVILTASGGPFLSGEHDPKLISPEEALAHPTWEMGKKVTIDSATMMNKGFEVIEAHWLFGMPFSKIDVVVHPQSIVHSMVELVDGAILAQLGVPDMRLPIQYALTYPERLSASWPKFDLTRKWDLSFQPPDFERFPCLRLAYEAGQQGGTVPAVLSAADEVAVERFLSEDLSFSEMPAMLASAMSAHDPREFLDGRGEICLESILAADEWARRYCSEYPGN